MSRLIPTSTVGRRWAAVIAVAQPYRRDDGVDPMQLWAICGRRVLADALEGPMVYCAIGHQVAMYTGQTDDLAARFRKHLSEPAKAASWSHVAYILLRPDTPARVVGNLETTAKRTMRPVMGTRTPRPR